MYILGLYIIISESIMTTKVQKWGNSLAVRIPQVLANKVGLREGSTVSVDESNDAVLISPAREKRETLQSLVSRISKDNLHSEVSWGKPVGKEIW